MSPGIGDIRKVSIIVSEALRNGTGIPWPLKILQEKPDCPEGETSKGNYGKVKGGPKKASSLLIWVKPILFQTNLLLSASPSLPCNQGGSPIRPRDFQLNTS